MARCLAIAEYFGCEGCLENPATGLLRRQPLMQSLAWTDTCYCQYGFEYRTQTRLWHSRAFGEAFEPRPVCCAASPCPAFAADGAHPKTAQRGASHVKGGGRKQNDRCSQVQLYSMPPELCDEIARAAEWVAQLASLLRMLETHKWRKQTHRTGIATSHQRTHHTSKEGKAYTVCRVQEPQQSEYHARGEMYEHVRTKLLPEWLVPGEFFGVTLNRNTVCKPHRDKKNVGESAIMFLGDFEGGALLLEDGRRFEKRGVWHRYDGRALLHWNEDITAGTKFSVIAHNNTTRPLVYPYKEHNDGRDPAPTQGSQNEAELRTDSGQE